MVPWMALWADGMREGGRDWNNKPDKTIENKVGAGRDLGQCQLLGPARASHYWRQLEYSQLSQLGISLKNGQNNYPSYHQDHRVMRPVSVTAASPRGTTWPSASARASWWCSTSSPWSSSSSSGGSRRRIGDSGNSSSRCLLQRGLDSSPQGSSMTSMTAYSDPYFQTAGSGWPVPGWPGSLSPVSRCPVRGSWGGPGSGWGGAGGLDILQVETRQEVNKTGETSTAAWRGSVTVTLIRFPTLCFMKRFQRVATDSRFMGL